MIRKPLKVLFISFITVLFHLGTTIIMIAAAQEDRFPSKPINLIIGTAPGSSTEVPARALAKAAENIFGSTDSMH